MALTLAQLEGYRDSLVTALSRGEMQVMFGDRLVMFQNANDLKERLKVIQGQIDQANARPRQTILVAAKGL